jgi:hypothetical protein
MTEKRGRSYFLAVLALAAAFAAGCGPGVVTRPMRFAMDQEMFVQGQGPANGPAAKHDRCAVSVKTLADRRSSTSFFTEHFELETFAKSVPQWVRDGVLSLEQYGYDVHFEPVAAPTRDVLTADLTIQKAYVNLVSASKVAIVVLGADYAKNGAVIESIVYRGQETGVNWANSADELEGAMNAALTRVLAAIAADIDRLCSR